MKRLTVGSLFAGIGGFDLGFELAGFEIRWQVEIDPFCRAVLAKHWPDVRRYEDVRQCCGSVLRAASGRCAECGRAKWLSRVDYIVGGFPCQDLSSAGKRAGIEGERSGLWREFIRIVAERRPRGVVLENVHHSWRGWVPVLRRALWELGYASLPIRLCASDFGADHERRRVFIVAHIDASVLRLESWRRGWPFWEDPPLFADAAQVRHDESGAQDRSREAETVAWDNGSPWEITDASEVGCNQAQRQESKHPRWRKAPADADGARQLQQEGTERHERGWAGDGYRWPPEPDVVRVVYGVPSRAHGRWLSDRVATLGNAVVPVEVEWIARRIKEAESLRDGQVD